MTNLAVWALQNQPVCNIAGLYGATRHAIAGGGVSNINRMSTLVDGSPIDWSISHTFTAPLWHWAKQCHYSDVIWA